ncbi:MAG: adenylate/guanylate cyclase domain-containing protein [Saprospiraceae bacterium]|nr:adenylate/guanylate cyclase domain-containing protein [Saprospiraceae bacterium]
MKPIVRHRLLRFAPVLAAVMLVLGLLTYWSARPRPAQRLTEAQFQPEQAKTESFLQKWQVFGLAGPQTRTDSLADAIERYQKAQYASADTALGRYLDRYADDSIARFYRGLSLLYQKKPVAALPLLRPLSEMANFAWRDDARWYCALAEVQVDQMQALRSFETISRDPASGYRHAAAAVLANRQVQQGNAFVQLQPSPPQPPDTAATQYALLIETPPAWWQAAWWRNGLLALSILLAGSLVTWQRRAKAQLEKAVQARTAGILREKELLAQEKDRSEELLLNILPAETMQELKKFGHSNTRRHEMVTVLFSDFKDFTRISEILPPEQLVANLDYCFQAFDRIVQVRGLEKIKTVGDCYVCAGGLTNSEAGSAAAVVRAAQDMIAALQTFNDQQAAEGKPAFEARIGIHTGPLVAGIVGIKKYAYDIWGDTVNIAARMEQSSEGGRINISEATFELVKDQFNCVYRGKVDAKGKGPVDMYFVEG